MNIFDAIVATIKPVLPEETTLTITGRRGQGNENARVHYMRENLVLKVGYRQDISSLGKDSEPFAQYLDHFKQPNRSPWTPIGGVAQVQLAGLLKALRLVEEDFIDECVAVINPVLAELDKHARAYTFARMFSAKGKGNGIELIVVFNTPEEFAIIELSMNLYLIDDTTRILRAIEAKKKADVIEEPAGEEQPVEKVAE